MFAQLYYMYLFLGYLEWMAVLTGLLYVLLATGEDVWCWPFGILSSAIYIYINLGGHLYQDAILQSYYVLAGLYGWWAWSRPQAAVTTLHVHRLPLARHLPWFATGVVLTLLCGYLFSKVGNSYPYVDAAVTVFSFIATYLTARKVLENWLYWIVIDLVAAPMYYLKELRLTTGLYLFFAVVAYYGYRQWKKQLPA